MLPGQKELPGFEPRESNETRRLVAAPLKPTKPQKAMDIGLFSDHHQQVDLEDLTGKAKVMNEIIAIYGASREAKEHADRLNNDRLPGEVYGCRQTKDGRWEVIRVTL